MASKGKNYYASGGNLNALNSCSPPLIVPEGANRLVVNGFLFNRGPATPLPDGPFEIRVVLGKDLSSPAQETNSPSSQIYVPLLGPLYPCKTFQYVGGASSLNVKDYVGEEISFHAGMLGEENLEREEYVLWLELEFKQEPEYKRYSQGVSPVVEITPPPLPKIEPGIYKPATPQSERVAGSKRQATQTVRERKGLVKRTQNS